MEKKLQGKVLLCGIANAGKSTIINKISQYEFALTNKKPQTTRKDIKFLYQDDSYHILIVDTPGFHFTKNQLDIFMNQQIYKNFKDVDVVSYICDLTHKIDQEAIFFMNELNKRASNKLVVIFTKSDLLKPEEIQAKKENKLKEISQYLNINNHFVTGINDPNFIKKFLELIDFGLSHQKQIDFENQDNDNFLISETIRGVTLNLLHQEIPYGIHVHIEDTKYQSNTNLFSIEAHIICEAEAKKRIIIGKNANKIKAIGIQSREKLSKIYDAKIFLNLIVKVSKD